MAGKAKPSAREAFDYNIEDALTLVLFADAPRSGREDSEEILASMQSRWSRSRRATPNVSPSRYRLTR